MDDALTEKGRAAIRELIGEVRVGEDSEGVFAELNLGRAVYISHGAQELSRGLLSIRARR